MEEHLEVNEKPIYCVKKRDNAYIPKEVEVTFDLARLKFVMSSGEIQLKFSEIENPSYLFFTYLQDELVIEEIQSFRKRIGHGRILLETLLDLVKIYNIKVDEYNKNASCNHFKHITKISGTMREGGGITHEELKTFYHKCGFLKNNRLLKEIT
ncbi:hypothetical protein HNR77_004902 [Paenibacillus sp. JGP012]|uniref:hypothetical protein n=1 Tax=Paenibacillus sp. JGP012 TaxID=2735914 RepID=UPI001607A9C6|nr:hypothetical protein [Paenibacillus sp. JGP012]MBB6023800.1 hypothetical protein [Paenibacillus sp. JGP012]